MRRQLLAIALRDTLRKHGIPSTWVTLEARPTSSAGRDRGMHMRLAIREWDERFPTYLVAFQKEIATAVRRLDPLSSVWLTGISWRFVLVDDEHCPKLPHPETWLAIPALLTTNSTVRPPQLDERAPFGEARPDFAPTQPLGEQVVVAAA
jgi:hypothetical protein